MKKDNSVFAQRIKFLRTHNGLTQEELAEKLHVGRSAIANYEAGKMIPRDHIKLTLCIIFNCSIDYLMGYTSIEHPAKKIEKELSKLNISENEYSQIIDTWLKNRNIPLPRINKSSSKVDNANAIIFDVYLDYLKQFPNEENSTIEESHIVTNNISDNFIKMLYTLDKSKIVYKKNTHSIPIYGTIPAGIPMEMIEDIIDYEELSPNMFIGNKEFFGLKIKGDSMSPDYLDGDIVIFQKANDCENGDDCVVSINGDEATFKRVYKNKSGVVLHPLNNRHSPLAFTNEEIESLPVKILGIFEELRRKKKKTSFYY